MNEATSMMEKIINASPEVRDVNDSGICIQEYTPKEIKKLRKFIEIVQDDQERAVLACWGNHSEYCRGY